MFLTIFLVIYLWGHKKAARNMKNLLDVEWDDKITFCNTFPLYEKVSFDFEKGETLNSLTNKEGNIIRLKTVTRNIVYEEKSAIIEFLLKSCVLRRTCYE